MGDSSLSSSSINNGKDELNAKNKADGVGVAPVASSDRQLKTSSLPLPLPLPTTSQADEGSSSLGLPNNVDYILRK